MAIGSRSASIPTAGSPIDASIVEWGGVPVEPAAPKADGQDNTANVPEVGARLESFNGPAAVGTWDRARSGIISVVASFLGFLNGIPYGVNGGTIVVPPNGGAPLQLDANGRLITTAATTPSTVGTEGNAWAAAVVGIDATSASIDCQFEPFISIFGNSSGPTTLTMQVSQDNVAFYDGVTHIVGGGGNFYFAQTVGARFVRLKTSLATTITATIAGKD